MSDIQTVIDKQAITECLMRYCRGVDRQVRAEFEAAYWPDATDDHIKYVGGVQGVIDYAYASVSKMRTQHMMGNVLIEMRGPDRAVCESYVHAYHEADAFCGGQEMVSGARYLDVFEKRGSEWRIIHRKVVVDWYKNAPTTSDWRNGRYVAGPSRGEKQPDDPLYTFEKEWLAKRG